MQHLKAASRASIFFILFLFIAASLAHAQDADTKTTTTTTAQTDVTTEQQEKPQPTPEAPSKSVVRGRVIYDDTNRPVRRARILLLKSDGGGSMEKGGVTNERGEFNVKDVGAGSYFVMVEAPGLITPISSIELEEGMDQRAAIIAVRKEFDEVTVNGTNKVDVQIRARRGGVVTGRVTYQDGDPATSAQIIILRKKDNRLIRFITGFSPYSMLSLRTDDRGVYRIAGLPPGEYVVGASETNTRDDMREEYAMMGLTGSSNFSVSYYKNETSLKQATSVKVEGGQEATEINITLIERALYTISGTVMARQSKLPIRARVSIQSKSEAVTLPFMDAGQSTTTDEQGHFSFTNVPDGTYVIKADPGSSEEDEEEMRQAMTAAAEARAEGREAAPPVPKRPGLVPRQQDVNVSGSDLSGIVLELGEGGRVRGTVVVEGGDKRPIQDGMSISLSPRGDGSVMGSDISGYVQQDGNFIIDKVPSGEFYVSVNQLSDKFYVKSITVGGTDLMSEPIRIGSGSSVENVRITISSDVATLQGRVVSAADSKPVRGSVLMLVPSDPARWRSGAAFLPAATGADGTFKITAAPGSYLLILLGEGENLRFVNEAFIKARSGGAKSVTLTAGGSETIELVAPAGKP
ncbi:MAG TPA: carboxypeptidase-like regulatory domain-containing protein [Pyrinomonadaceae bacterium]|nr:carboxypeptidase-like regulatory domain-containing protein [Pyrinomonadaceae bacterium]